MRRRRWELNRRACAAAVACVAVYLVMSPSTVAAQNTVSIGSVSAGAGATGVVVPIMATTATDLTGLSVEIGFPAALCDRLTNQTVQQTGRASAGPAQGAIHPEEGAILCPNAGAVLVVLYNLTGETVLPPGSGEIAQWTFSIPDGTPLQKVPLTLHVRAARNGPTAVDLAVTNGDLTVICTGDCNNDHMVDISELVTGVNIALDIPPATPCSAFADPHGQVPVNQLVKGVNNALNSCPPTIE